MNPHFAKLADIWKHLSLNELLRHGAIGPELGDTRGLDEVSALTFCGASPTGSTGCSKAMVLLGRNAYQYLLCDRDPRSEGRSVIDVMNLLAGSGVKVMYS